MSTDGYFSKKYGTQCKGMAGACTAATQGARGWLDWGVDPFNPIRRFTVRGAAGGYSGLAAVQGGGAGAFGMFSSDAPKLTNSENARSMGIGGHFEKYAGLFAEQRGFDVPPGYSAGVNVMPVQGLSLSADVGRIEYSKVKAIGPPMPPNLMTARLGTDGGARAFRRGRKRCRGEK